MVPTHRPASEGRSFGPIVLEVPEVAPAQPSAATVKTAMSSHVTTQLFLITMALLLSRIPQTKRVAREGKPQRSFSSKAESACPPDPISIVLGGQAGLHPRLHPTAESLGVGESAIDVTRRLTGGGRFRGSRAVEDDF